MIIVEPCAGLGNRFIGLASGYHAAKAMNEKLTVVWKQESVMGADIAGLFALPQDVEVISIKEYGYKKDFFGQIRGNLVRKRLINKTDKFMECDDIMNLYNQEGVEGVKKLLKTHKDIYIKATNPFWNIFDTKDAFDFIKPQKAIMDKVNSILQGYDSSKLIGVHIRRTDHIEAIKNSPLELFIEAMNKELLVDRDTCFYVATDDVDTWQELRKIFGDRIMVFEDKSLSRDDHRGIVDAYVEMLCLANTRKIYGSFNSTFSRMASCFGHIPLEVVKKEVIDEQ